jgi:hypothetical protein
MRTTTLENKYEVENIIRTTGTSMFKSFKMPFYANDTAVGTGHAFKFHRSSEFNAIWPTVLEKLHSLGLNEWAMSCTKDYTDLDNPKPAKWIGIRSARLPRNYNR